MMGNYWKDRIIKDEARAQRLAGKYGKEEEKYYKRIFKEIEKELDGLYTKIQKGEPITRSELWQYEHYKQLRQEIYKQCGQLGMDQISITDQAIEGVVKQVLGVDWKDNSATGILNRVQTKQFLNQAWSGESYSSRIYHNCNTLANRLETAISDMICLGKSPDEVKKAIMDEMNVSYNVANRLIRTEASYTFNTANVERYRQMGTEKVEIYIEPDACDQCQELKGVYDIDKAPLVPVHPNCRCCYLPVV